MTDELESWYPEKELRKIVKQQLKDYESQFTKKTDARIYPKYVVIKQLWEERNSRHIPDPTDAEIEAVMKKAPVDPDRISLWDYKGILKAALNAFVRQRNGE